MRYVCLSTLVLVPFLVSDARAACNLDKARDGIIFCRDSCNSSGHHTECNGSGYMHDKARNGDPNGVREGFEQCHGDGDESENVKACLMENGQGLLKTACAVYGDCPAPPAPPPPTVTKIEFNKPMKPASDNRHIVIADFELPGKGNFSGVTVDYRRDGKRLFELSTYAIGFSRNGDKLHLKITTYDIHVRNVARHKYTVAGTLEVVSP